MRLLLLLGMSAALAATSSMGFAQTSTGSQGWSGGNGGVQIAQSSQNYKGDYSSGNGAAPVAGAGTGKNWTGGYSSGNGAAPVAGAGNSQNWNGGYSSGNGSAQPNQDHSGNASAQQPKQ